MLLHSPCTSPFPSSLQQRKLRLVSYFSPLLAAARGVARKHKLSADSDVLGNMLKFAPPLEVPWTDVALHIAHRQVRGCVPSGPREGREGGLMERKKEGIERVD